ncbi:DUF7847 domain-containing protein [Acetivibrio mesophilus]|uniref:DUF7847 domain-containing protein n=1 Tax=Acetivibrio mesophilus TaxID=2487273 RepID=A0A4Q0I6P2_9FIRM|nr:hypothetical protein [Acetivibrio mesophilus]ODM25002.1 hypothetical protein A7W90_01525 [Clostridium sp. Bc-iso-3]RXE60000.1 hypothetical protein EFD62_04400 [Acetivibrio mesophilus]HHV29413.1 hypothetical protein [Clostridium sp.]
MNYLERIFKFLGKYFVLAVPLIIATAIPVIISGSVSDAEMTQAINELSASIAAQEIDTMLALTMMLEVMRPMLVLTAIANIVSFVLNLFVAPATYGMINKGLETDNAGIGDFFPQMGKNLPKYIIYTIFNFFVDVILVLVFALILCLFVFLTFALKGVGGAAFGLGIVLTVIVGIVLGLVMYGIKCILSYWFPAMVVDNMNVISAFKKSIEIGKSYLWQTIGVTILISIASSVITGTLGVFAGMLPYVGYVLISIPAALGSFITLVFYMTVYRDKTRNVEDEDEIGLTEEYI